MLINLVNLLRGILYTLLRLELQTGYQNLHGFQRIQIPTLIHLCGKPFNHRTISLVLSCISKRTMTWKESRRESCHSVTDEKNLVPHSNKDESRI